MVLIALVMMGFPVFACGRGVEEKAGDSDRRGLLQTCGACPANAAALCASMSPNDVAMANKEMLEKCSQSTFDAEMCCNLRGSAAWERTAACACAGQLGGQVNMDTIATICGCGEEPRMALPPLAMNLFNVG